MKMISIEGVGFCYPAKGDREEMQGDEDDCGTMGFFHADMTNKMSNNETCSPKI